mmetsp:Transcript_14643/g.31835  ORF Transcript_14643/g.31835 Transcript_14643/m.31835 type:complete len:295 (+) Transcript_14643:344-1228(+)|eukprot:CAMPEP_0172312566 /NCGR_PEP_ID=MMETSP1058-20130122/17963_1 /TAXON_ID=83371 /ORGANISM="Detonula confervacea, Strain CCMP 353" /LENGTH=294 /DNA_ID=CAMNT_0013026065 /DNA_START=238 /DNA_END=1122 /DNA_ORIENTATION=+
MLFSRNELKPLLHQVSTNDPELTSLQLSHKKITNKQLLQISDALKTNTNINEIWLTHNQLSDDTDGAGVIGYLMGVLETNRTVGEVYLGGNKIGVKGASSIANLLQKNNIITDIGLEDNKICDGGGKMLADALSHNSTLQTLKLHGNDIQTERTLITINELLKKNRESAKKKFAIEHPELQTHKLKKPEEKRKKKSRSGSSNSGNEKSSRSKDSSSKSRSAAKPSSKPSSTKEPATISTENSNAFLEERKKSIEDAKQPTLMKKLKGLGGLGKKQPDNENAGVKKNGMKSATFV